MTKIYKWITIGIDEMVPNLVVKSEETCSAEHPMTPNPPAWASIKAEETGVPVSRPVSNEAFEVSLPQISPGLMAMLPANDNFKYFGIYLTNVTIDDVCDSGLNKVPIVLKLSSAKSESPIWSKYSLHQ